MNNTLVREAAKAWVKKLDPKLQLTAVTQAYQQALGRKPAPNEIQIAYEFLKTQGAAYGDGNGAGSEKAFADFCQTLFGLNEFLYVN